MTGLLVGAAAIMVAGVLWSERRRPRAEWLFKPLASLCFVLLALAVGALDSGYGRWLLAGLVLCLAGDVLLIPRNEKSFLAGLASFLAGHLLYAAAFLQLPQNRSALLLALVPALLLATSSLRWLWPHVPATMRWPVMAYVLVISLMLLLAGGTWSANPGLHILLGAWGFAISDLFVARHQFVRRGMINRALGLPLYYAAQLTLAYTPALALR